MGCFNTLGWYSKLQMSDGERIFCLICVANINKTKTEFDDDDERLRPNGRLYPIALPIFGVYDSYGRIENIHRRQSVLDIENFFGVSIEKFIEVVDDITTIDRCGPGDATYDLYQSFRKKLGLTNNYYVTGETNLQIVLVYDFVEVYDSIVSQCLKESIRGYYDSRQKIRVNHIGMERYDKYRNDYIAKYGTDTIFEEPTPNVWNEDSIAHSLLGNGWCDWWHILDMYRDRAQVDEKGELLSVFSEEYDHVKLIENMINLLCNDNLADELIKFTSFMWFLHRGNLSISYSYPTGQEDINSKIREVAKCISKIKEED